ncbi:MAG: hypothetical protein RL347_637 [Actinomycetota bacterium]|jgi:hypothetical protein
MLLGSTLRELIGGRWAVSLLLFIVYVPLGILATIGNLSTSIPGTTLARLLLASTLSLIPVGLILWVSSLTWLRDRRQSPAPVWSIVLLGTAIGSARSASMYAISVAMGIQDTDSALAMARTISGGIQGAASYPLAVLAFALIATYREQRRQLIGEQIAWETRRLQDAREWTELRDDVITPIAGELQALGADLDERVISIDEASSAVRARAHDLWGEAQPSPLVPRVRLGTAVIMSLRTRPFATWLILAIWLPTALGTALAVGELPRAPIGALVSTLVIAIVFEIGNAVVVRWPSLWGAVLPVGLVLAIVLTSPSLALVGGMPEQGRDAYSAINAIWLMVLVVLSSIVMGALRRGEAILLDMHAAVDATTVETLAQEEERRRIVHDVAATLHGSLQGRLASLPDPDGAGDAVRETLALLQSRPSVAPSATVRDVALSALDPWHALIEITLDAPAVFVDTAVAQAVSDVIEECVSNSFRHGRARHVTCTITESPDDVDVTIADDGCGSINGIGPAGLGSRILDRSGSWTRTYEAQSTTVRIRIPR